MKFIQKLRRYARRWGGDILVLSPAQYDERFTRMNPPWDFRVDKRGFYSALFVPDYVRLGVHFRQKIVALAPHPQINPAGVIHEMAHVFASRRAPDHVDEFEFLGWEWVLAERIGATLRDWQRWNKDYIVNDGDSIGDLTGERLDVLLRSRMNAAMKLKLLDLGGNPLAVR